MRVDRLTQGVIRSIGPVSGGYHVDKDGMRTLLEKAGYQSIVRRGLELYAKDFSPEKTRILLLDNELKIYDTNIDDILVRKEPFLSEMLKIRNIRRILNDSDVVIAKRAGTVGVIRQEVLNAMDFSFTENDILDLDREARKALEKFTPETVSEILSMFAEILSLTPPEGPIPADIAVYGRIQESGGDLRFGPLYIYSLSRNLLHRYNTVLTAADSKNPGTYKALLYGETEPEAEGEAVIDELREKALAVPGKTVPVD